MDMCRIRFKNFRNLGVGKEGDGAWLDVGGLRQGGLICLIGANNAGKSNVLEGITKINKGLEQTDCADFMDTGKVEPCVCLELLCRAELTEKTFVLSTISDYILRAYENENQKKLEFEDIQKEFRKPVEVIYGKNEDRGNMKEAIFLKTIDGIVFSCTPEGNQPSTLKCLRVRGDENDIKEKINVLQNIKIAYETAENKGDVRDLIKVLKNPESFVLSSIIENASEVLESILKNKNLANIQEAFRKPVEVIYGKNEDRGNMKEAIFLKTIDGIVFSCTPEGNQPSTLKCLRVRGDENDIKEKINVLPNIKIAYETAENKGDVRDLIKVLKNPESVVYTPVVYTKQATLQGVEVQDSPPPPLKFPNIVLAQTKPISDQDCTVSYEQIEESTEESTFFKVLFDILKKDEKSLLKAYQRYKEENKIGYLDDQENDIEERLQEVVQQFNKMYAQKGLYNFKVKLRTDNLSFHLYEGRETIFLDRQSTGFKKFFNLFFSFLYKGKIGKGDLVLIDEPENSLSIPAQKELQRFLREFGQKNGITFIVSTHSPFMLDTKHLDSIRLVVKNKNGKGARIQNNFSSLDLGEVDVLKEIVEALGFLEINFREVQLIFVEGIMDYNILSAYQEIRDTKSDFVFLPIDGVGEPKEENKPKEETIKVKIPKLLKFIKTMDLKKTPILLFDGDRAGDKAVSEAKLESMSIPAFSLKDISNKFKTIESLFSQEDREKFDLSGCKERKVANMVSSAFKNTHDLKDKLSDETKENLEAVFKFLKDEIDKKTDNDDREGVDNGAS
ncbi:AAA family ATPase [Helicobacter suis]|uniref:AAA family ATPase n=1 Tax=Helicobacter suis TaxID=104628 RepID=UPI0013D20E56|nr:AAA family ATPase [Helicobacter suis]